MGGPEVTVDSVVWVLVCHSAEDMELGIVTEVVEGVVTQVLVRNCCIMSVPDEAEVICPVSRYDLAKFLRIDIG